MDQLVAAVAAMLGKVENMALIISMLVNLGLGWAHIVWRREERQDRAEMLKTFNQLTEALNGMRIALTAVIGKVIQ